MPSLPEDADWWLAQSLKRDETEARADSAFEQGKPIALPPPVVWHEYPCDVCAKRVGETGHIKLTTMVEDVVRRAALQIRCQACYEYLLKNM